MLKKFKKTPPTDENIENENIENDVQDTSNIQFENENDVTSDETHEEVEDKASGKISIAKAVKFAIMSSVALVVVDMATNGAISSTFVSNPQQMESPSAKPINVSSSENTFNKVKEVSDENKAPAKEVKTPAPQQASIASPKAQPAVETIRVNKPSSLNVKTTRTLEQFNTDQKLIETLEIIKQQSDENKRRLESQSRSTDSLRVSQKIIFDSIVSLHKFTSSEEVSMIDGSFISPKKNGSSYDITSASDITTSVEKGTFIMMPSGYIVQNSETTTIYFAFTNPNDDKNITNLYEVSSLHGLRDKTEDMTTIERVKDVISKKGDDERIISTPYKNAVVAFNEYGEIASVKNYKKNVVGDNLSKAILDDSIRNLNGFYTMNNERFRLKDNALFKNGRVVSIDGQTTDLTIRYVEYQPSKTENRQRYIEVINANDMIIKRISTGQIKHLYLTQATVQDGDSAVKEYIYRDGNIFQVHEYGEETLQGSGSIVGKIMKGALVEEKIILEKIEEKFNELTEFAGKILEGVSGNAYSVDADYTRILPGNNYAETKLYFLSSKGSLVLKDGMEKVDSITTVKNKNKIGGRIISDNYIVEITSLDKATVFDKKTQTSNTYFNPEVRFVDNSRIVLYANVAHKHNADEQTINGISYSKVVQVRPNVFNYYDAKGELIKPQDPDFDFNKILVLEENVSDVEKIEGDAFDYIYRINLKTGEISAEGIGKMIITSNNTKTAKLFTSSSEKVEIANKANKAPSKAVLTLGELVSSHPHLPRIKFKMMNEDEMNIVSSSSIIVNNKKVAIESGKYNTDLGIFVFNMAENTNSQQKRQLTGSLNSNRFERTVRAITNEAPNYFSENVTVVTLQNGKKVVGIRNAGYDTHWTSVYDEEVNLKDNEIVLTIKPFSNKGKTSDSRSISLDSIKEMSKTMRDDMIAQFTKYEQSKANIKEVPSESIQRETENIKILEAQLNDINAQLSNITGKELNFQTYKMSEKELEIATKEEKEKNESVFNFDIGTELTYEVEKSLEVVEGQDSLIYTSLDQSFIEDREGNTLSMSDPIVVLKVTGDFNTNKVKFFPVQVVYTDEDRTRQIINIPDTSTVMEYKDDTSGEVVDGVPSYYVDRNVANLGTKVMLSTASGMVEAMTTPDDGFAGALAGITGDTATEEDTFTNSVASGAAEGINEILESMKEKTEGKQDLLITVGGLKLKSVFVTTTPINK